MVWDYQFHSRPDQVWVTDFVAVGPENERTARKAFDLLSKYAVMLRVLGSYPRYKG